MALIRWEPVRELSSLQNEMNRLFGTFFDTATPAGNGRAELRRWVPAMDLVESESHYVLRADLPGVGEDDVRIELEDNVLTLSGERPTEHEEPGQGFYRVERATGSFARSLVLPEGVEADAITARFERGVLEVRIPKPQQRTPRRVAISVDGAAPTLDGRESEPGADAQMTAGSAR